MLHRAIQRLILAALVMLTVVTLVFVLLRLSSDPLAGFLPPGSNPEQQAALRSHFGLDEPLPAQYLTFLGRAVIGDFGTSWRGRQPALDLVLGRLPATLALAAAALLIAMAFAVPFGALTAASRRRFPRLVASAVLVTGQAVPGFVLGLVLILVFAVRLGWLPSSGNSGAASIVLPAVTLAAFPAALMLRLVRQATSDQLAHDYVRTARAQGLPERWVIFRHALPNALLPVLAYAGIQAGFLLGGAVVVESVFAYPGLGRLALQAVTDRDLPVVQAFVVVMAGLIVTINLVVDLVAAKLDPRIGGAA